jgi:hypothetical protein
MQEPLFRSENLDDGGFFEILDAVRVSDIYTNNFHQVWFLYPFLKVSVG